MKARRVGKHTLPVPGKGSENAGGIDLYSVSKKMIITKMNIAVIHTGWSFEIPENSVGLLVLRSGFSTKNKIILLNGAGIIDSDYRGEIMLKVFNLSEQTCRVLQGQRIAQLVVLKMDISGTHVDEVDGLSETKRGTGGFGSTG